MSCVLVCYARIAQSEIAASVNSRIEYLVYSLLARCFYRRFIIVVHRVNTKLFLNC